MAERNQLISSCYDKRVRVMDLRTPVSVQHTHQEHSKPVLCVTASNGVVYSGSEDKTLCAWDLRTQRLLQKIQVNFYNKDFIGGSISFAGLSQTCMPEQAVVRFPLPPHRLGITCKR